MRIQLAGDQTGQRGRKRARKRWGRRRSRTFEATVALPHDQVGQASRKKRSSAKGSQAKRSRAGRPDVDLERTVRTSPSLSQMVVVVVAHPGATLVPMTGGELNVMDIDIVVVVHVAGGVIAASACATTIHRRAFLRSSRHRHNQQGQSDDQGNKSQCFHGIPPS